MERFGVFFIFVCFVFLIQNTPSQLRTSGPGTWEDIGKDFFFFFESTPVDILLK